MLKLTVIEAVCQGEYDKVFGTDDSGNLYVWADEPYLLGQREIVEKPRAQVQSWEAYKASGLAAKVHQPSPSWALQSMFAE